jgi:phosphoribosylformylglycinamidine synthase
MKLKAIWDPPEQRPAEIPEEAKKDPKEVLRGMLSRLNICSKEYVIRQYDHEVQGGSVIKPLVGELLDGPSDAAVIRPILTKERGVVVSNGICPRFSDLDTYWMMAWAIDEAIRNAICVGANPYHMAGVDNFCWCDPIQSEKTPDGHYKLAQLVRANMALAHFCMGFGIPCVSGKDSMKNDYVMGEIKISIPPTVLFSLISVIDDVTKCITSDFKRPGDLIYILGLTKDEMGGSEFASYMGMKGGFVPQVDLLSARNRYRTLYRAIQRGLVSACHDISDGGLGVCVCEMCIGGNIGAVVSIDEVPTLSDDMDFEKIMYSETPSRFVVSVPKEKRDDFEELFKGQIIKCIGEVTNSMDVIFKFNGKEMIRDRVDKIRYYWKKTLNF